VDKVNKLNIYKGSKKIKWTVIFLSLSIFLLAFAGYAFADEELPTFDSFYGSVVDAQGQPLTWQTIQAFIDDQLRSTLNFSSNQQAGKYGMPIDDPSVDRLLINGYPSDVNEQIIFKVTIANETFIAQTSPSPVLYQGYMGKRNVDLTVDISVASITGLAKLEKVMESDPEPDHSNTVVAVYQGENQVADATTDASGAYMVNNLVAEAYNIIFTNSSGSWKKTTLPVNLSAGTNNLETVTLYIGDMNQDGSIDILDLLWMAARMGPVHDGESQRADVNNDSSVDILDLLRVAQNIGK